MNATMSLELFETFLLKYTACQACFSRYVHVPLWLIPRPNSRLAVGHCSNLSAEIKVTHHW